MLRTPASRPTLGSASRMLRAAGPGPPVQVSMGRPQVSMLTGGIERLVEDASNRDEAQKFLRKG